MIFTDEADARLLLSSLQPAANTQQLLEMLKASQNPESKANVDGNLTIALLRTPTGQQSFQISISEGKRQQIIDGVARLRQNVYLASRNNFKMPSHERGGSYPMTEEVSRHGPGKREQCVLAHWQQAVHDHLVPAVASCQMSCGDYPGVVCV